MPFEISPIQNPACFYHRNACLPGDHYSKDPEKGRDIVNMHSGMEVPAGEAYAGMDARYADSLPDWT